MPRQLTEILAASAIITVGATVQATVGFGLGLVAAPVLLLIEPMLVPGPLMASGVILTLLMAYRERQDLDFREPHKMIDPVILKKIMSKRNPGDSINR